MEVDGTQRCCIFPTSGAILHRMVPKGESISKPISGWNIKPDPPPSSSALFSS